MKNIVKKIAIAILIVVLFQFATAKPVQADVVEFGGKLMSPIMSLFVTLMDGVNDIISSSIMGVESTLVHVDLDDSFWDYFKTIVVGIVAAVAIIVAIVATAGLAAVAAAAVGITATVTFGVGTVLAGVAGGTLVAVWYSSENVPDDLYLPIYTYSAEEIFQNNVLLFNVNFFSDPITIKEEKDKDGNVQRYYYKKDGKEITTSKQDSIAVIKNTVSSWYNALRNICIVLMLSVLVYIAIRMLLSSVASDKAKYITMLKDWFIGLCMLFLMHYIMAFSVTLVEKLTEVVGTSVGDDGFVVVIEDEKGEKGKLCKAVKKMGKEDLIQTSDDDKTYVAWPTNLMGKLRLQLQMEDNRAHYVGYGICFIILVLFTLYFTIIYLKRVLNMAFLTLIAPMVALTYCIDKVNDGQAQGFNKWFKEYIFNLLIQPMHLLLYYILVTSAIEFASLNVIYSIVALGFMIPAEKLLRSLFGFEKSQTAPILGTAGAMMATSALNHVLKGGNKGKNSKGIGSGKGGDDDSAPKKPPKTVDNDPVEAFAGEDKKDEEEEQPQRMSDGAMQQALAQTNGNVGLGQYSSDVYDEYGTTPSTLSEENRRKMPEIPAVAKIRERFGNVAQDAKQRASNAIGAVGSVAGTIGNATKNGAQTIAAPIRNMAQDARLGQKIRGTGRTIKGAAGRVANTGAGTRIRRTIKASAAAQKAAIRMAPQRLVRKIANAHPMKAVGKTAAGAMIGGGATMAGVAIAASSGDPFDIPKAGFTAGAIGYKVASGKVDAMGTPMDNSKVKEVYNDTYNGPEYEQEAMSEYVKKYLKDVRNQNYLEQKIGKQQAKEMLKKGGEVENYLNNDISDIKEIAALHKLKQEKAVNSVEEGIAISQMRDMIGSDTNKMKEKDRNEWKDTIQKMADKNKNVKDSKQFAEDRMKQIDKLNDIRTKL